MTRPHRTIIVGAGLAGTRCALTLRRLDPDRGIVLVGDEPHDAYERPPLSKEYLIGTRGADALALAGCDQNALATAGIDFRRGARVAAIGHGSVRLAGPGEELAFDQLVLATGARPRTLPNTAPPDRMHVLRSLDDAVRLRRALAPGRHLVIVGSGFVGAEVAGSATALGARVTLVEAAPVPFERTLGTDAGAWLVERWLREGVHLQLGVGVDAITGGPDGAARVVLSDGTAIDADDVLVAIGTIPNDDLFHAAWPLVGVLGRGIPTDADGRTSIDSVFAIGDVALVDDPTLRAARRVEHWTDAAVGAQRLARLLAGTDPGARPAPYAWSDQFGVRMQVAGDVDPSHRAIVDERTPDTLLVRYVDGAERVRGIAAAGHPALVARYRGELAA